MMASVDGLEATVPIAKTLAWSTRASLFEMMTPPMMEQKMKSLLAPEHPLPARCVHCGSHGNLGEVCATCANPARFYNGKPLAGDLDQLTFVENCPSCNCPGQFGFDCLSCEEFKMQQGLVHGGSSSSDESNSAVARDVDDSDANKTPDPASSFQAGQQTVRVPC
jgi:hypothetical protein